MGFEQFQRCAGAMGACARVRGRRSDWRHAGQVFEMRGSGRCVRWPEKMMPESNDTVHGRHWSLGRALPGARATAGGALAYARHDARRVRSPLGNDRAATSDCAGSVRAAPS